MRVGVHHYRNRRWVNYQNGGATATLNKMAAAKETAHQIIPQTMQPDVIKIAEQEDKGGEERGSPF